MKTYTETEINTQFDSVKKFLKERASLLEEVLRVNPEEYDEVLFVGCGSSYHLALSGVSLFREYFSPPAQAIPGSEVFLSPETHFKKDKKYLVFLLSRSGESTETVMAGEFLKKEYNATILSITTEPESTLVKIGDISVILKDAREVSVVMTQSFTVMFTFLVTLFKEWKKEKIFDEGVVDKAQEFYNSKKEELKALLKDREFEHFVFLGQGYTYGLAQEGALKVKEMSISFAEAFHSLEYRHGPKSIVTRRTLVFMLPLYYQEEKKLAQELESLGAKVVFMGDEWGIPKGINREFLYLFWVPIFHEFGLQNAFFKGVNPDNPKNLTKVVKID